MMLCNGPALLFFLFSHDRLVIAGKQRALKITNCSFNICRDSTQTDTLGPEVGRKKTFVFHLKHIIHQERSDNKGIPIRDTFISA